MGGWNEFQGLNAGYVLELYDRYRQDPAAVDAQTRAYFEQWTPPDQPPAAAPGGVAVDLRAVVGAATLAESIRRYGHLAAQIDPLGSRPTGDPTLAPAGARHHRGAAPTPARQRRQRAAGRGSARRRRGHRRPAAGLLHPHRLRLRAGLRPRRARVAAPGRRDAALPAAHGARRRRGAARPHHRGRDVRAVPAPDVPRQDALLGRRARHAGADPGHGHRRRPTTRACGTC